MNKYSIASIKSTDTERNDFHRGSLRLYETTYLQHPYRFTSMIGHDITEELLRYWKCIHEGFSHKVQDLESILNKNDTEMTVTATYMQ